MCQTVLAEKSLPTDSARRPIPDFAAAALAAWQRSHALVARSGRKTHQLPLPPPKQIEVVSTAGGSLIRRLDSGPEPYLGPEFSSISSNRFGLMKAVHKRDSNPIHGPIHDATPPQKKNTFPLPELWTALDAYPNLEAHCQAFRWQHLETNRSRPSKVEPYADFTAIDI